MFKSKLEKFIAKRALIILAILSIMNVVFIKQRWLVLGGLLCGSVFSLLRLNSMATLFAKILSVEAKNVAVRKSILSYAVNQLAALVLLIVSIKVSLSMFAGMAAGILLVPATVFINGITESIGITHNNFE